MALNALTDLFIALSCGALTGLALPRPGLCLLAWVSLAPLFALWRRSRTWKDAARIGMAAGMGYHGLALYWIFDTCRFAGLSMPVGLLAWGSLTLVMAVNWGVGGAVGWRCAEREESLRPWAWAALWTAIVFISERWTPRLCVDLLAYTQWQYLPLLQVSALAGPHLLGFLVVAANVVAQRVWSESGGEPPRPATAANLALVLGSVFAVWAYGAAALAGRDARIPGAALRVELLQPAVDQYQKFDAAYAQRIRAGFDELLARPRSAAPALVLWPETCLPYMVDASRGIPEVEAWARRLAAPQIVGVVSAQGEIIRNSAVWVSAAGVVQAAYHKRQLVPFGEFVPLPFLRRFIGLLNQMGGLTPGQARQAFFETPWGPLAAGICYEAMFPHLAQRDAGRGARVLVNLTNDGWYKGTWGPYQHFQANVFRAVEDRVTVLRCGNTGISAVIDPWGRVTAQLGLNERGRLDADVPLADPFPQGSVYSRAGDWFGWLCLAAAAGLIALGLLRRGPRSNFVE
ncbi:MAG: apolipoprotein N-acyltransferase [Elusimicrobiota bacterium]|jgi:apolipoprotein N-acyltransferase